MVQFEIHRTGAVVRSVGNFARGKEPHTKDGDRVAALGQNGAFVVYCIDADLRCVELKLIGQELRLSSIPGKNLTFLDKGDASQAAARIVREAIEQK